MFVENMNIAAGSIALELTEEQLKTVSGGLVVIAILAILIAPILLPEPPKKPS